MMQFNSKLLFASGILAVAVVFGALNSPAHARWWKVKEGYQGPLCVSGQERGNISLKWGNWSANINGNKIRQQGAFNYQTDPTQKLPPYVSIPVNGGLSILSQADKLVSHMQRYTIEIPAGDSSQRFFISDRTASVRHRSCSFLDPFRVRL